MTKRASPCVGGGCSSARVLRRIKQELTHCIGLIDDYARPDDRAIGQREAFRHLLTVIENQRRLRGTRVRR